MIGRFGNQAFQYAFGCQYNKYNISYYLPSQWKVQFCSSLGLASILPDDDLRLHINQTSPQLDTREYRLHAILDHNSKTNDCIENVDFAYQQHLGKLNIAFDDLSCMYSQHNFDIMDKIFVKSIFQFTDEVKESNLYKTLEEKEPTISLMSGEEILLFLVMREVIRLFLKNLISKQ